MWRKRSRRAKEGLFFVGDGFEIDHSAFVVIEEGRVTDGEKSDACSAAEARDDLGVTDPVVGRFIRREKRLVFSKSGVEPGLIRLTSEVCSANPSAKGTRGSAEFFVEFACGATVHIGSVARENEMRARTEPIHVRRSKNDAGCPFRHVRNDFVGGKT